MKKGQYKILIPTDFSEISRHAIQYVLDNFSEKLTHLYLLNAYKDNLPGSVPLISLIDILREKSERLLKHEEIFVKSVQNNPNLKISSYSRFDGYLNSIREIAVAEGIDLVVIGTNGHSHPRIELREDDPSFLLQQINLPLLLVPQNSPASR